MPGLYGPMGFALAGKTTRFSAKARSPKRKKIDSRTLALVNAPERFAELGHVLICADRDAQHIVERREGPAHRHALQRHRGAEMSRVAADIDHQEIGIGLDITKILLSKPCAEFFARLDQLGAPLRQQSLSL